MPSNCLECGAVLEEGSSCQEIFESLLALEYTDPAYGEVHFLTVACFMIQHGRYSDEGLAWIERTLRAYLEEGLTTGQLRRQAAKEVSNAARSWKVTRPEGAAPLPAIQWEMRIPQVAEQAHDARRYREAVRRWARLTLDQWTEPHGGRSGSRDSSRQDPEA